MAEVIVKRGDLTVEKVDAIVNPANSYGYMGGGVAWAIKRAGGKVVEDEAVSKAPIPVGSAVETTAGSMSCKYVTAGPPGNSGVCGSAGHNAALPRYVIHAPTMTEPAQFIGVDNVRLATLAALAKAKELGVSSLAFPGMGTGVGGLSKSAAAKTMVESILEFNPSFSVYLIGFDVELTEEFRRWLAKLRRGKG
jgi:O-acetyl-ADP-ribose deacetylase